MAHQSMSIVEKTSSIGAIFVKLRLKQKEAFTIESEYLFCYQVSNFI